ncbi:MAG TPA: hypothetical protein VLA45_09770 [Paracoccaceae bacterium]|nr:hypothetical protein [Paracoccaceae bacterium]
MSENALRDWSATLAVLAAVAVVTYGLTARYGWFETVFIWPVYLFGSVMIGMAVYKGATKLLLLVLPVFLIPPGMGLMLLYACSQGDCL